MVGKGSFLDVLKSGLAAPPSGLRAHSTRGMATSLALFRGISRQESSAAANWSLPVVFVRHYLLDISPPSVGPLAL